MKNIPLLLRREYYRQRSGLLILGAFCFLFLLLKRYSEYYIGFTGMGSPYSGYINLFLLVGLVFTSMTFSGTMHSSKNRHAWLMLPVHAHEKLAVKILAHSLIYPAGLVLFTFVSSLVIEGLGGLFWENHVPLFSLMDERLWLKVANYCIASSLFLLGGAFFRKNHFIKTCLAVMLLMVFLTFFTFLAVRVIHFAGGDFPGDFYSWNINEEGDFPFASDVFRKSLWFSRMTALVYWVIFPLFCWTVTYFRIREKEAKDAV